jgi:hypothetical protein
MENFLLWTIFLANEASRSWRQSILYPLLSYLLSLFPQSVSLNNSVVGIIFHFSSSLFKILSSNNAFKVKEENLHFLHHCKREWWGRNCWGPRIDSIEYWLSTDANRLECCLWCMEMEMTEWHPCFLPSHCPSADAEPRRQHLIAWLLRRVGKSRGRSRPQHGAGTGTGMSIATQAGTGILESSHGGGVAIRFDFKYSEWKKLPYSRGD